MLKYLVLANMASDPDDNRPTQPTLSPIKPLQTPKRSDSLRHPKQAMSPTSPSVATMPMSPGGLLSPLSPTTNMNPAELALQVQRRAEAATAALRKSPSIPKMGEGSRTLAQAHQPEQDLCAYACVCIH